jgi:hypothetical protein
VKERIKITNINQIINESTFINPGIPLYAPK